MLTRSTFAAVVWMSLAVTWSLADDQLPWAADYAAACQQANAQGKLVLLHFYSDDCPPCVRVERNVFSQPAVAEAVGRCCVPVKVHVRKTPELATKYRVQQWPTDVFVRPDGQEVTRSVSPQSPDVYINMTTSIAAAAGVNAARQTAQNIPPAQPSSATTPAPWTAPSAQGTVAQVNAQADAAPPWMVQGAGDTKQQLQQTAQQYGQSAQQLQQGVQQQAQQQGQQVWQTAQGQVNQAATGYAQYAQQAAQQASQNTQQSAQQSTQAAADAAKEVINRYAQPLTQSPPVAPQFASLPATQPAPTSMPWQAPSAPAFAATNAPPAAWAPPAGQPTQTLAAAAAAFPAEANPALAPAPAAQAAGSYPVAMSGYCPVTLATEKKWKKGQPQFGVMHRRRTFLFASEVEQKKFLLEPDRYSPVMTGYDPVKFMQTGELVDGNAGYSLTYRKQVYLFTDDTSLKTFWQNPAQFTEGLRQAMTQQEGRTLR
jgi:thiol-disulfide isomerase/thioredoxin/YHS domain-containing protein